MQHTGARVAKNAAYLVATGIVGKFLGLLVTIAAARQLGAANFGVLAFALAFTDIFGILVICGFNTLITREVARDESRASRMMGDVITLQSILAIFGFLIMIVALRFLGAGGTKRDVTYIAGLSAIAYSFLVCFNAYFRARQTVQYEALVRFFFSVLRAILLVGVLLLGYGLLPFVACEFLAYMASLILCFSLLQRRVARPSFAFDPHVWRHTLRAALPFAGMTALVTLYVRADTIILSLLRGDEITGWYSAATRFFFLFAFLPSSIIGAVLPAMAKQSVQPGSGEALLNSFARTFRFLFITALPIALGVGVLAEPIVRLLYGDQFIEATPALQILMVTLVLSFVNWAGSTAMISLDQERTLLTIAMVGFAFNVSVNVILVPYLGHIGASLTSVLSEGLVLLLKLRILSHTFGRLLLARGLGKPLLSGLAMATLLLLFRDAPVLVLILLAAPLYVGALLFLRAFDSEELAVIRMLLSRSLRPLRIGRGVESE